MAWGCVGAANGQIVMTITEAEQWAKEISTVTRHSCAPLINIASLPAPSRVPDIICNSASSPLCPHLKLFKSDLFFSRFKCLPPSCLRGSDSARCDYFQVISSLSHNTGDCAPSRCDIVTLSRDQCVMSPSISSSAHVPSLITRVHVTFVMDNVKFIKFCQVNMLFCSHNIE